MPIEAVTSTQLALNLPTSSENKLSCTNIFHNYVHIKESRQSCRPSWRGFGPVRELLKRFGDGVVHLVTRDR